VTPALKAALAELRAAGRVWTHGPDGSVAFEIADTSLQVAAIRFVVELARSKTGAANTIHEIIGELEPLKRS